MRFLRACLAALGLISATRAPACLHPPKAYPGKMGASIQEYLFFRDGERVHLVTRQTLGSDSVLPDEVAWVIPLPTVPEAYHEGSDSLFRLLHRAFEDAPPRSKALRSRQLSAGGDPGYRVHATQAVGDFSITPVEILDTGSGREINDWFKANGYAPVPGAGLAYYLRAGACFLAIKVKGLTGRNRGLRPLHIVYQAQEARIPFKFFAKAGSFPIHVYVAGAKENARPQPGLQKIGFRAGGQIDASETFRMSPVRDLPQGKGFVRRFIGTSAGGEGKTNRFGALPEDPLLDLD